MAYKNWMRTYTIKCGQVSEKGFEIGNINDEKETALHVCFSVEKSDVETANTAKVQIWNLSDDNLSILDGEDCVVELKAGYDMNNSLILAGNITSVTTTMDSADRMTELEVVDGRVELRDSNISVSLNGSINCKDIYNEIATAMGVPIHFASDLSFVTISNGFSFVGKARNALQKVANYCGHKWTMQNQILQITWPGRPVSTSGFLLSSDTGLIGVPKRITLSSTSEDDESQTGWEVVYFMNGAIGVNDIVVLSSNIASGYYRVYKVTLDGDNLEGDWQCTAQLLEIKAEPILEAKSTTSTSSSTSSSSTTISKGDKVVVTNTFTSSGKTKGYQYTSGTFVCWYDEYDVIQVSGDRVVIGIGSTVTAAVNIADLKKV